MMRKKSTKLHRSRKSGRGIVVTLVLLFALSLIIRLADAAGPAIAREVSSLTRQDSAMTEPAICEQPPDIAQILVTLEDREAKLDTQLVDLLEREQMVEMSRRAVEAKINELERAEQQLAQTIAMSETASEGDLAKLTSVYENMKPAVAADLFEKMDPEFAAGFIGRMRPEPAASIMTGLAAEKAYAISVILAGRNANAPRQ